MPDGHQLYEARIPRVGFELTPDVPRGTKNEDVVTHSQCIFHLFGTGMSSMEFLVEHNSVLSNARIYRLPPPHKGDSHIPEIPRAGPETPDICHSRSRSVE